MEKDSSPLATEPSPSYDEKKALDDGQQPPRPSLSIRDVVDVSLKDADEARAFLENHPMAAEVIDEGQAILDDPEQLKKLIRKIDWTIPPLIAAAYFLQFLDKTSLSVGISSSFCLYYCQLDE